MITGRVTQDEVIIPIRLRGANGTEVSLDALLDTGFNRYLTLSPSLIEALDLPFLSTVRVRYNNRTFDETDVYEGAVRWDDGWNKVEVHDQGSEEMPLIGMALLRDNWVAFKAVEGGAATIEPVEEDV